ncbi:MAG: hypothetical protein ACQEQL_01165 [Pseudomonadota bacterium]
MSREYALSRVQDALESCEGNTAKAQRVLMNWLEKDQTLMIGLVAPHLKSIVTHAVSYVARHPDDRTTTEQPESPLSDSVPEGDATGTAILESLLGQGKIGGGQKFGEFDAPPTKPGKASAAHVDAIHQIARKQDDE